MERKRIHRTAEMKAQSMVHRYVKTPADLKDLLRQFSPAHHAGIIERLKPHLAFDPSEPAQ